MIHRGISQVIEYRIEWLTELIRQSNFNIKLAIRMYTSLTIDV
jgi:hypothetical protein